MDPRQNGGYGRELSRAERFEEEKRRIVDSCFNKKDVDGSRKKPYIISLSRRGFYPRTTPACGHRRCVPYPAPVVTVNPLACILPANLAAHHFR